MFYLFRDKMKFLVIVVLFLYFGCVFSNSINSKPCGVVASDNPIHQNPWLVLLEYHHNGRRALLRCGGSLIDSRHILTSAHCVEIVKNIPGWRRSVTILPRLGEYDMSSRVDCVDGVCSDPVTRMVVESIFVHPWFRRDHVSHDLAILVLETDAPYTDFIRPVCLPERTSEIPTELYASGFGDIPNTDQPSQIKKNIRLPYYSKCPQFYERIYKLPKDGFCAGGEKNVDTCNGDSGGSIVWVKNSGARRRAELWGVIKGGTTRCGLKGKPGVYTSVLKNLLWIEKVIEVTSQKQETNGTRSRGNENGEQQNVEKRNEEKEINEKKETKKRIHDKNLNVKKENKEKPNIENQRGERQDEGKNVRNFAQIQSGSSYLLLLMLVYLVLRLL